MYDTQSTPVTCVLSWSFSWFTETQIFLAVERGGWVQGEGRAARTGTGPTIVFTRSMARSSSAQSLVTVAVAQCRDLARLGGVAGQRLP